MSVLFYEGRSPCGRAGQSEPVGVLPVGPLLPSGSSGEQGGTAGTSPGGRT